MHSDGRNYSRKFTHHSEVKQGTNAGRRGRQRQPLRPSERRRFIASVVKAWANGPQQGLTLPLPSDPSEARTPPGIRPETGRCRAAARRSRADDPAGTDGEPKGARKEGSAYFQVTTPFAEQHDPEITTVLFSALPTKKPVETAMSWLIFNSPVWLIKVVKPECIVIKTCYFIGLMCSLHQ